MAKFIEIDHYEGFEAGYYSKKLVKVSINIEQIQYVHNDETEVNCYIRFSDRIIIKTPYTTQAFLKLIPL